MDLIYNILPNWIRKCVNLVGLLGALVFTGAIGLRSALEVEHMFKVGVASQTISILHWPFAIAISIFSLLALLGAIASFLYPNDDGPEMADSEV
jgi:TRAP-type C4-dicarboxylate transport system permease small subunit